MRQLLTLLLLTIAFSLTAQHNYGNSWNWRSEKIKGNGDVTTENRDISGFDGVTACCNINVELRQGSFAVKVEAESNLLEYIRTEVSGGRLEIGFTRNTNISAKEKITVYVSLPELEYVGGSSSSSIVSKSNFKGEDLELDVSSGAYIELDFSGERLYTDASSGGKIRIRGDASRIKADASSGARIDAGDFVAKTANAGASSGGGVTVNASEALNADASSGGSVRYNGSPANVNSDTSSGGSVRRN